MAFDILPSAMKWIFEPRLLFLSFIFVVSCAPSRAEVAPFQETATPLPASTATTTPPPTYTVTVSPIPPSSTPILCNPYAEEFCTTDGNFILQKPIHPPANDNVDLSYRYGTTVKRTRDPHQGVEFLNKFGTPVHAAGDGEVVFAGMDEEAIFSPWKIFYGNLVVIRHANDVYTLYAHLSKIDAQTGQQVEAGEKIGEVGQTGVAIGSHLHFEVRRGGDVFKYSSTQNPELWLIPKKGTGVLSATIVTGRSTKLEREVVITGPGDVAYYVTTYAKGFEYASEDLVVGDLPAGEYRIAFVEAGAFYERLVEVRAGKLTEVVFVTGQ
ncbi:MAG: hypothetical protein C4557_11015 [Anaerolineaceae bacterium]|nr:MAG: hypothetical protein C4557_11015 [Anaerolineaceae bacterium]